MQTLLFIHGIGVRGDSWFSSFDLISRKAGKYLPNVEVKGCHWGEAFGARLHRGGATIPGYDATGNAEPHAEDASRARWFLLSKDPLLELRIAPKEKYLGQVPGIQIFNSIPLLSANATALGLLREWSVAAQWDPFIRQISLSVEWKATVKSLTGQVPAMSDKVARAIVAAFEQYLGVGGFPNLAGSQRDTLTEALIVPLGGPALGVKDWLLKGLTNFGVRHRGSGSESLTPAVGDVVRYQARGEELRNFIAEKVKETGATIILAHSLGGIAAVDWLASPDYVKSGAQVSHLITAGSQSPYLYEIDALVSRPFGSGLPESFPPRWLNFYDPADFLSYMAEPAFPGRTKDIGVDNGQPFPESHSAYWHNDTQVWENIATFLAEGQSR